MSIALTPPYQDLTFMTALSDDRANRLARFLATDLRGTVVDIGCGWGELLLRVVAAAPNSKGVGVDVDSEAISHAEKLADQRGLSDRVTWVTGDAEQGAPDHADAIICIGSSHAWSPSPDGSAPLDYASALAAIRARVSLGCRAVYGEAIWSSPPTPASVAPLGGRLDELVSLAEMVELAVDCGFMLSAFHEATLDEWDEFESGYGACFARWLAAHPADHSDAEEVRSMAKRQREGYLRGYRGIMGMAYLELIAV